MSYSGNPIAGDMNDPDPFTLHLLQNALLNQRKRLIASRLAFVHSKGNAS